MWKVFYGNLFEGLLKSKDIVKLRFLRNSLMSIATWRWPRWPYCNKVAKHLDSVQAHFVQLLFPLTQLAGEEPDAFFARVRLTASKICAKDGTWSHVWASSSKTWDRHHQNGNVDESWSTQISEYFTFIDLETVRTSLCRGAKRGRTDTRATPGHVFERWSEGLEHAREVASLRSSLPTRFFGS